MKHKVYSASEIAPLKRVIVHRPDRGIARVSPKRAEELLFDDIVYLPKMREEHAVFVQILEAFLGKGNVLEIQQLIKEALGFDAEGKQELLEMIVEWEELPSSYVKLLDELPDNLLAKVLISGYLQKEDIILFDPIPNYIFTRDIAVVIKDHVIITKAAKDARFRENFLTRFVFWCHPMFRELRDEGRIININIVDDFPPSRLGERVSIEGGDVMVINEDYVLIGCSERTNAHAIRSLRDVLFAHGVIKNVVQVNIPQDRTCMHIDTILTQISEKHFVGYKPIVIDGMGSYVEVFRSNGETAYYHTIKDFLQAEIHPEAEIILSGQGISPYQEREQWTDGCNLVTLKPGVALTYDRNPMTEKAFEAAGYRVVHARDLLEAFLNGVLDPEEVRHTIITLPSNELSRARGGSHCMTCPVERGGV